MFQVPSGPGIVSWTFIMETGSNFRVRYVSSREEPDISSYVVLERNRDNLADV